MKNRIQNLLKSMYRKQEKRRIGIIKNQSLNLRISKSSNKKNEQENRNKDKQKGSKRREEAQNRK